MESHLGLNQVHTFLQNYYDLLVAYWRRQSIKVVLYLDDGLGFAENNELCYEHAQVVKNDIVRSGLVPNKDKRVFGYLIKQ